MSALYHDAYVADDAKPRFQYMLQILPEDERASDALVFPRTFTTFCSQCPVGRNLIKRENNLPVRAEVIAIRALHGQSEGTSSNLAHT